MIIPFPSVTVTKKQSEKMKINKPFRLIDKKHNVRRNFDSEEKAREFEDTYAYPEELEPN